MRYSNSHENNGSINIDDSNKKLVKKLDTLDFRKVGFEISQNKDYPNRIIRRSTNKQ